MITGVFPRLAAVTLAAALLSACQRQSDLSEPPVDLGPFDLGLNIVVADNAQKVPISRDATPDEWESALKKAVGDRFGRYDGPRFYNIGINVDGYALAPPGIPVVAAPKSVLVVTVNLWDDERQQRLSGTGKQFTIFEGLSGEAVIGSGLTRSKREQMEILSYNAAKTIETWFLEHPQWFGEGIPVPDPVEPGKDRPAPATPVAAAPVLAPATTTTTPPLTRDGAVVAPDAPAAGGLVMPSLPGGSHHPETP